MLSQNLTAAPLTPIVLACSVEHMCPLVSRGESHTIHLDSQPKIQRFGPDQARQAQLLRQPGRVHLDEGGTLSIYRKFDAMRLPSNDIYARTGPSLKRLESPVTSPQDPEHKHRRKAAPANVPLPRTLNWVESLPSSVRPTALLRQYARIANVLAATWADPKALSSYMDCLVRDDRGNRKGFPPDVLRELLALREYHANVDVENRTAWAVLRKRG